MLRSHRAVRPLHLSRTRARRGIAVVAAAGLVAVGVGAEVAQAAPQQVLQSVSVTLGPDGTVSAITSNAVARSEGEDPTSAEQSFDPATTAGDLPVRILTSWRVGDETGTDLSEAAGLAGRAVVDVTVQNTTVRPERISYDSGGSRQRDLALVGTPLTVVASADLGDGGLGQVVTTDDLAPDQVTDGALSVSPDGTAQVQWASILAPPRLASSTTFRLVTETDDFTVPTFSFAVQPGMVTDPSIDALLTSAFSEDADSTVEMENATITLISDTTAVLGDASNVLSGIEEQLRTTAGRLGQQTIADLRSSQRSVTTSVSDLRGDLGAMQSRMKQTLQEGNDGLDRQLLATVTDLKDLLGDPRTTNTPAPSTGNGCDVPALQGRDSASLYEQLLLVGSQLRSLANASDACAREIQGDMRAAIGPDLDLDHVNAALTKCATPLYAGTATCTLLGARARLVEHAKDTAALTTGLKENIDPTAVAQLGTDLDTVVSQVEEAQRVAHILQPGNSQQAPVNQLRASLQAASTALGTASTTLGGVDIGDAAKAAGEIQKLAQGQAASLGSSTDTVESNTLVGQVLALQSVRDLACDPTFAALVADPTKAADLAERCARTVGETPSGALLAMAGQWSAIETQAALLGDLKALGKTLGDAKKDVDAAKSAVDEALTKLGNESEGGVITDLFSLTALINGLVTDKESDAGQRPASCPALDVSDTQAPLNAAMDHFDVVQCKTDALADGVDGFQEDYQGQLDRAENKLGVGIEKTERARSLASDKVGRLTDELGSTMNRSAERLKERATQAVTRSRTSLDDQYRLFRTALDKTSLQVVNQIKDTVTASTSDLGSAGRQLSGDLEEVLTDLGTRGDGGTGILGTLSANAVLTDVSNRRIGSAAEQASSFGNVRTQALDSLYLEQAQLTRSLELAQAFPAFGIELPEGSRSLTVFSFTLGGE